jgi:serine/threonine-protein kinase RsbW
MTNRLEGRVQGGLQGRTQSSTQSSSSVSQNLPGEQMDDAQSRANKRQRGHRAVELHVAARLENLAMLRTLVGAIGTFEDLDFDAVADLRLAVDEVCTRLIRSATPNATLVVVVDPRDDELVVEASAACDTHDVVAPGSFSWHVLTSLADDVNTFHDGREPAESGSVFGITLTARRVASGR